MVRAFLIIPYMGIFSVLFVITLFGPAVVQANLGATISYDCGSEIQNLTTISLLDIDDCDLEIEQVNTTSEDVVLLQLNKFEHLEIIQCKVEISRQVNYCGMFSHNSIISNVEYIYAITRDACQNAHLYGTLAVNNIQVKNLHVNETSYQPIRLAGYIDNDGDCEPAPYSDPYGSWPKVIVEGNVKVTLKTAYVKADIEEDLIYFPSGFRCKLSKEQCIDIDGGHTFWKTIPERHCSKHTYSKLYKGPATKFESRQETVYSVNVDDTSFSLKVTGSKESCGVKLFTTDSSKLFLMMSKNWRHLERSTIVDMNVDNMDMFEYINAKFVYVERHIRSQIKSLYYDVLKHHCKLEKEMLKNTLAIASTQPDEFAFRYMGGPGYMAVLAGEVVHIVQCVPVEVKIRRADKCYNRLPIERGNKTLFMTPRTRIISKYATEIPCNLPLLETYKIQGKWWKFGPEPMTAVTPVSLKPSTKITWTYQDLGNLATSGIYTRKDLDDLNNRIMSPVDYDIIAISMTNIVSGGPGGAISFSNAFDEHFKEQIAEDVWAKTWGKFIKFGTTCAGIIGIFVCISMIKAVLNTIINGRALYGVFGLSFKLLAACWDTLSNILISKEKEKRKPMKDNLSTPTIDFDKKSDFEKVTTDQERRVQNNTDDTFQSPTPAPRRFHE